MDSLILHGVSDVLSSAELKYAAALKTAGEAFNDVEKILQSRDYIEKVGWKKEDEDSNGTIVYTKKTERGKMVIVNCEWSADVDLIMKETWEGVESVPQWNSTVTHSKRVFSRPFLHFDICHYIYADMFVVTGRDTVCARVYRKKGNGYLLGARSVCLDECPERKDKVRMELIIAGLAIEPHPSKPGYSLVQLVAHSDPKGYIPTSVINQVIGKMTLQEANLNGKHYSNLAKSLNK